MKLSVVIPAYNEENRIGKTLEAFQKYLNARDYDAEVIVVDDGSTDKTKDVVEQYSRSMPFLRFVQNGGNKGKGYSVRHGAQESTGEFVLFSDADASTPIEEIEKFWPHFENGAAVCIGSRSIIGSDVVVHQPWYREAMGRTFNLIVRIIALGGFIDTQCGFKAFTSDAARAIFSRQRLHGFGFDVELLYIARLQRLSVVEVPIRWINSPESKVHPLLDSSKMILELMAIRWHHLMGRYR